MAAKADGKCVASDSDFVKVTCDGTALGSATFTDDKCTKSYLEILIRFDLEI